MTSYALSIGKGTDLYITLTPEGHATGYNGHVDLGTGIEIALAQIVADLEHDRHRIALHVGVGKRQPQRQLFRAHKLREGK